MDLIDWNSLDEAGRRRVLRRPVAAGREALADTVAAIVREVRERGDAALAEYARHLDGVTPGALRVPASAFAAARRQLGAEQIAALETARDRVRAFHEAQRPGAVELETAPGVVCRRVTRPLDTVGLYVPAGSAPLPSTVIMLAVPAEVAGCPRPVIATPPRGDGGADPSVLVAAGLCGVTEVYVIGGAQAVAALAYGTETVPAADKIFGPGNAWVTEAKLQVSRDPDGAACDLPAGPSEVLVVADDGADPGAVAADLLSQAEHGPDSQVILVTPSRGLAEAVAAEVSAQLAQLPRAEIARHALDASRVLLVRDLDQALDVSNAYAPEHLILALADAEARLEQVRAAGSVFLGYWTPESLGDYCSGTNHVLPTYGYARAYSGLGVEDFQRRITVQAATRAGLEGLGPVAVTLARLEGLDAHAEAVIRRLAPAVPGGPR